jgi:hypothetical protein
MENILDISNETIENILEDVKISAETNQFYTSMSDKVKRCYFVGATLFIDMIDENIEMDCMTFNYTNETVGWFSGGTRKLLSIESVRLLRLVMKESNINHEEKIYI